MTITIDGGAGITFPDTVQQTNATTNTGGTPRYYAARAWVTFDGSSGATSILSSVNVSSVVRNSTGDYTITFTSAMPNANYAVSATAQSNNSSLAFLAYIDTATVTTTTVRIQVANFSFPSAGSNTAAADSTRVSVVVFA